MTAELRCLIRLGTNTITAFLALMSLSACSWLPFLAPPIEIGSAQAIDVLDWQRAPDGMNRGGVPPDTEPLMALRVALGAKHSARQHAVDCDFRA